MSTAKHQGALSSFWGALSPWGKRAAMLAPILVVGGILAPYALAMLSWLPFAAKSTEAEVAQLKPRVVQVEQRIDLQERIAIQREILKIEEESRRRTLTQSEKNYLQDLKQRLSELERRK
jgi:hypothetical protein